MASVSIILDVHNQENSLQDLAIQLEKAASGLIRHKFEFIYVDNGSTDGSYAFLRDLASRDRWVQVIRLTRDFGRRGALQAGITYASGDCVIFLEVFPGTTMDFLPEMISLWESGVRVVTAAYQAGDARYGSPRELHARLKRSVRDFLFKDIRPMPGCPFLLDRQAVELILDVGASGIPVQAILAWATFKSAEVTIPVSVPDGISPPVTWRELIAEWSGVQVALSHWPVRLSFMIALAVAVMSLIAGLGIFGMIYFLPAIQIEGSLVGAALLLAVAVQLAGMGLLGKYMQRLLEICRGWPAFIAESVINEPAGNHEARERLENLLSSFTAEARRRRRGKR